MRLHIFAMPTNAINLRLFKMFDETVQPHTSAPSLCLFLKFQLTFAICLAGEELCWDYQYELSEDSERAIICYCGTGNCRGRLR